MIKRICDCCGAEIKKEFVQFHINWDMADAVSGETTTYDHKTPSLEYCADLVSIGNMRRQKFFKIITDSKHELNFSQEEEK